MSGSLTPKPRAGQRSRSTALSSDVSAVEQRPSSAGGDVAGQPWERGADSGRRLDGRVAIVTGAGSAGGLLGIGEAIAVLFAAQGAKVGVADISEERAEFTRGMIEDAGGECVTAIGDLT